MTSEDQEGPYETRVMVSAHKKLRTSVFFVPVIHGIDFFMKMNIVCTALSKELKTR